MAIVDELVARIAIEFTGEDDAKRFESRMDSLSKKAAAMAGTLARVGAVAGTAIAAGFVALGKKVVDTSAKFETYLATLETIEGSAEKAKSSFDWISKFAVKTPFEMEELTKAFVRLKAYGLNPTDGTMKTLGDTASGMGVGLMQAVEMFADASTMEFERLKEFGLKAKQSGDQVTFSWTKNGKELTKTVKKNGDDVRRFILENLGDRFNGAMIRQSKTWTGMISNLGDAWTMFQHRIGRGGFFEAVKSKLAGLLEYIGSLSDNGTLDRWSQNLSNAFTKIVDVASSVFDRLARIFSSVNGLFGGKAFAAAGGALAAFALALAPIPTLVVALFLILDDLWSFAQGKGSLFGDFLSVNPETAEAVKKLGEAWSKLKKAVSGFGEAVSPVTEALGELFGMEANFGWVDVLTGALNKAVGALTTVINSITKAINLAKSAVGFFTGGDETDTRTNEQRAAVGEGAKPAVKPPTGLKSGPTAPVPLTEDGWDYKMKLIAEEAARVGANVQGHTAKIGAGVAGAVVTNDNSVANDNRSFPVTNNINTTVNQNVSGSASAQSAAGAVSNAAKAATRPGVVQGPVMP